MAHKPAYDDIVVGLAVIGFAGVVAWQTTLIPGSAIYAKVGPTVIPWMVVALLGILGTGLLFSGLRGGWAHEREAFAPIEWGPLSWLAAGLAANVALIDHIGFILASTILFTFTARSFGSRQPLRDVGIAFILAVVAYVGFDRVLGYKIGSGIIERMI